MAKVEQIMRLLRSHVDGDSERFYSIAMQVAAHEAKRGHEKLAQELKKIIDEAKIKNTNNNPVVSLVQPRGELAQLLSAEYTKIKLSELTFAEELRNNFERIIHEYRQKGKLRRHGLEPRRKILLYGPPGTGKTITASALASELSLPLFTIRLDGLITKFMGETASKLRQIFEAISSTRGVYFFDEFDAIGSDRGLTNDVGEIRRVLNSFLQFMENDKSDSLILAATNHINLLDEALFRRFDDVIKYKKPEKDLIKILIKNRMFDFKLSNISWRQIEEKAEGLSHAEITRACDDAAKNMILNESKMVSTEDLLNSLNERKLANKQLI